MIGAVRAICIASLLALITLCLTWEIALAPARPGGSWLMLKALPLLAPLFGLLHGRRRAFQWTIFLSLAYFMEGVMRAYADRGLSQSLALGEVTLSLLLFATAVAVSREMGRPATTTARAAD